MLQRLCRGILGFVRRPLSFIGPAIFAGICGTHVQSGDMPQQPGHTGTLTLPIRTFTKIEDPKSTEPKKLEWIRWSPKGKPINLNASLQIAMERQPSIKAAQASLGASECGYLALSNINRALALLSPDLPIRKQQAQKGLCVATAEVLKAQQETTYDVCRMYYAYIYATQQEQTANEIVQQMEIFYEMAKDMLIKQVDKRITTFTLFALEDTLGEIKKLRDKATEGRKRAMLAWKEAMGIGPELEVYPADPELPIMAGHVTMEQVIELALARRPELVQAATAVDVTRLEVAAQDRIRSRQSVPTFASGSDLHARVIPVPSRNGEYKPGAVPPEMPTMLVGKREDRVARALELSKHQDAVYEKAVGLVRLEAGNAFLHWESSMTRVKDSKERYDKGLKILEASRAAAATKMEPDLLVRNEALVGKAQAEYIEAVQKNIEALINLEKVTGGAVAPAFPGR